MLVRTHTHTHAHPDPLCLSHSRSITKTKPFPSGRGYRRCEEAAGERMEREFLKVTGAFVKQTGMEIILEFDFS